MPPSALPGFRDVFPDVAVDPAGYIQGIDDTSAGRFIYLDVALVYGVLSFLAVVATARYLERGL